MQLNRNLNLVDVFGICTGAMLSGLFILPGLAFTLAGPAILVSFFLAGLLALTGLFSQAELVSAMPKAGGTYFYVTRSMGSGIGTIYGLITWLSLALKSAYELLFLAVFIREFLPVPYHLLAIFFCMGFLLLNLVGVKEAGRLQVYLVIGILSILTYFALRAYPAMDAHNFKPFDPHGINGIISAAGFVFVSYGGLLKIASVAEEVKNPGKTVPRGMILSLLVIGLLYLAIIFVSISVLGEEMAGLPRPISTTASRFLGKPGIFFIGLAAILAIVGSANAGIMASSRYPLALARDEMLPPILGRINKRFKTPHISIFITGIIIILALFLDIKALVKAASCVLILTYVFTCIAVVILRESRVQNYQPQFRSPMYPWVQIGGIIGFFVLLFGLGFEAFLITCLLILAGFLVFWFYGRKSANREYALLHLIERITAKELTSHGLENELKEIIHSRDEILKDRFDHLVEKCVVLDIRDSQNIEDFFRRVARELTGRLGLESEVIFQRLIRRERESSTVLNQFLAIPHIIVEGEKKFDILLARCSEGIHFSPEAPNVHTVFVLIGSKDERTFHLSALAAIAQIIQDEDFEKRWTEARNAESLRDLVLLGKRKRQT